MNTKTETITDTPCEQSIVGNFRIRWRRLFYVNYSARYIRFKGDLCTYNKHLEAQQAMTDREGNSKDWIPQALKLCGPARRRRFHALSAASTSTAPPSL